MRFVRLEYLKLVTRKFQKSRFRTQKKNKNKKQTVTKNLITRGRGAGRERGIGGKFRVLRRSRANLSPGLTQPLNTLA